VELFEQIRREYEYGAGTIKGVAGKFGAHRRMVREALGDAVPRERKINTRGKPRIEPVKAFIDTILQGDENEPRKPVHCCRTESLHFQVPIMLVYHVSSYGESN
jgi:hypothetical protein